eukprot:743002_1
MGKKRRSCILLLGTKKRISDIYKSPNDLEYFGTLLNDDKSNTYLRESWVVACLVTECMQVDKYQDMIAKQNDIVSKATHKWMLHQQSLNNYKAFIISEVCPLRNPKLIKHSTVRNGVLKFEKDEINMFLNENKSIADWADKTEYLFCGLIIDDKMCALIEHKKKLVEFRKALCSAWLNDG